MLRRHTCQSLLSIIVENFPQPGSAMRDRDRTVGRADVNAVDEETYLGVGIFATNIYQMKQISIILATYKLIF